MLQKTERMETVLFHQRAHDMCLQEATITNLRGYIIASHTISNEVAWSEKNGQRNSFRW